MHQISEKQKNMSFKFISIHQYCRFFELCGFSSHGVKPKTKGSYNAKVLMPYVLFQSQNFFNRINKSNKISGIEKGMDDLNDNPQ